MSQHLEEGEVESLVLGGDESKVACLVVGGDVVHETAEINGISNAQLFGHRL